ncbi:MAG: hypothetical protein K0Q60_2695 [Microvirga sp.]|jgi:hypothetical protein|nr:hypothetical protein [Microvirga sp.]
MTRISVAHRPDISAGANRVIVIAKTIRAERRGQKPAVITDQSVEAV